MNDELVDLIRDELNVKEVEFEKGKGEILVQFDTKITQKLKDEGLARDIVRKIQEERKKIGTSLNEKVNVVLSNWPKNFERYIKSKAFVARLEKGEDFKVKRS